MSRPTELVAEQYTEIIAEHGEGPVWDMGAGKLVLVDMLRGDVVIADDRSIRRKRVGKVAAAIRPRSAGGWVLGVERGFALAGPDLTDIDTWPALWEDQSVRMNDGACDPYGAFLCGSLCASGRPGRGTLYRLSPDHTATAVMRGITTSNGLGWSADGSHAYFIDSATQRIDQYRYDETTWFTQRRPLARIHPGEGIPDGLAVDAEGGVWVALYGGSALHRYAPDGRLTHRVRVPVAQPTACTFGGPDLGTLLITTSRLGGSPEETAGAVFAVIPGVCGRPPQPFHG